MCHFWAQNGPFVLNKIFLVQTIIITFIYLLALFIVQNFKKLLQPIQSYEDVPFSGPKWPICHEQFLFGTNHYYYFHLPTGPFHCPKFFHLPTGPFHCPEFLKIITADPELRGCAIFGPKMVHLPQTKFFLENY